MIIYLANAKHNYTTEKEGYVMAQRLVEYPQCLYSYHFITEQGILTMPIFKNENLHGLQHEQVVDEHRIRPQPAGSGDA